jgi:hypothetical protein
MSRCKLRTPWPIHFKLRIVIGIDSLMVCILFGEISIFHSRVMGLYSSNCKWFFVCRAVNWEPLGQFTSNFAQLLELIVLRSVYFLVKFRFFIRELWERKSIQILYECWRRAYHALLAQLFIVSVTNQDLDFQCHMSWSFLCSARRWFFVLFILVELFKLSFLSRRVWGAVCTEIICYIYLFNQCLLLLKVVNLISFIFPPYKKDLTKTRIIFPRMIYDWNRLPQPP